MSTGLPPDRLARLVPRPPPSNRHERYAGDDRAVALASMAQNDREAVRALYELLRDFDATLRAPSVTGESASDAVRYADAFDLDRALACARGIGVSTAEGHALRRVIHDLRGGALTSLLIEVSRARQRRGTADVRALRLLTRDHLKMMRSAVLGLDDARRDADRAPKPHPVERIAETLAHVTADGPRGAVTVHVECAFGGFIAMSCVELGALDRAAFNLVNNAARHAATSRVDVALVRAALEPRGDLCVGVANAIDATLARALEERFGDDLGALFLDPFSTTGGGEGMKICVDFVATAYGLVRPSDAVRAGLVGALLDEGSFIAWLHWPSAA